MLSPACRSEKTVPATEISGDPSTRTWASTASAVFLSCEVNDDGQAIDAANPPRYPGQMRTLYTPDLSPLPLLPTKAITKALDAAPTVLLVAEAPPSPKDAAVALLNAALPHLSGAAKADALNALRRLTGNLLA